MNVNDFYNKIIQTMDEGYLSSPLKIELSLTDCCNQKCRHCSNSFKLNKNSAFFKVSFLPIISECNPLLVVLSGGEPLFHPHLIDIITAIKKNCSNIRILTNGTLITENFIKHLASTGWGKEDIIQVSLDACDRKVYENQRGVDDFNKVLQSIFLLAKHDIRVDVHTVPTKINKSQIIDIYELANENGAFSFSGAPLAPFNQMVLDLMCSASDLEDIHNQLISKAKNKSTVYLGGIEGELCSNFYMLKIKQEKHSQEASKQPRIYRCSAGRAVCYIDENGNVYPCVFMQYEKCYLGNINLNSLQKIWNADSLDVFRKGFSIESTICGKCQFWGICNGGCIGVSSAFSSNIRAGYDIRCYKTNSTCTSDL